MPLRFAPGPDNGTALIREGLDRTATRTSPLSDRSVDFSTLQVSNPTRSMIYGPILSSVAAGWHSRPFPATGI